MITHKINTTSLDYQPLSAYPLQYVKHTLLINAGALDDSSLDYLSLITDSRGAVRSMRSVVLGHAERDLCINGQELHVIIL